MTAQQITRITKARYDERSGERGMAEQIEITTRTRNLGYGWTNQVERVPYKNPNTPAGTHYLAVKQPDEDLRGSLRAIEQARDRARRSNSGNDWREALFVGGKRVDAGEYGDVGTLLWTLRETGSVVVEVA